MLDYRKDLKIDLGRLIDEWHEHAQKYMNYVEAAAEAEFEKNLAKENVGVVKAKLARRVKNNPSKFGITEKSESALKVAVKDYVDTHRKVLAANKRHFTAVKNSKIIEGAEHSMGSYRKTALEHIVTLVLRHGDPKLRNIPKNYKRSREVTEEINQYSKRNRMREELKKEMKEPRTTIKRRKRNG